MNKQELFDKAVGGVIKQGAPSIRLSGQPGPICCYRNGEGLKCAIGQIIPDDKYETRFDTEGLATSEVLNAIGIKSDDDQEFLIDLQECHDNAWVISSQNSDKKARNESFLRNFKSSAQMVAEEYQLTWKF